MMVTPIGVEDEAGNPHHRGVILASWLLEEVSMRCDTTKLPMMFNAVALTASIPRYSTPGVSMESCIMRRHPTAVMPEMAFVTDRSGVRSARATPPNCLVAGST